VPDIVMLRTRPFPPEPRGLRQAKALQEAGYSVRVVAWDRERAFPRTERIDGVEVVRVRIPCPYAVFPALAVALPMFWLRSLPHCLSPGVRAVHCADLDSAPPGLLAARLGGRKLVLDLYDSYPAMMAGSAPPRVVRLVAGLELRVARAADLRVVVSEAFAGAYRQAGAALLLPNTGDPEDFDRVSEEDVEGFRRRHGLGSSFVVSFVGVLMPGRGIEQCIAACEGLEGVRFLVAGFGQLEDRVRDLVAGSRNSVFIGRVPPSELPLVTKASDAVMNVLDPGNETYRLTVPNKVYDALMAGRRVLVSEGTHSAEFVARAGIGRAVRFGDVESLRGAIRGMAAAPGASGPSVGRRSEHAWKRYAADLVSAYDRLIGPPGK
jgi:glycosyltransferase involved in cell wall biosynthesis